MSILPILFNTEMVQALLEGKKTVARRVIKGYVLEHLEVDTDGCAIGVYDRFEGFVRPATDYAPYRPGDILYVRETWSRLCFGLCSRTYVYRASDEPPFPDKIPFGCHLSDSFKWHPSIHMPKEAARIFLRVKTITLNRLRDMVLADVFCEGITEAEDYYETWDRWQTAWDSTIPAADRDRYSWSANPWVWVISFERCEKPAAWP